MDISFVSDGWSHAWNPERFPGRPGQRFPTTATTTPNLAEVMARQTELLNLLVQAQQNQHRQQSRGGRDDLQVANYQDFFSTQPPLFSKVEKPLDADAWLAPLNPSLLFLRFHVQTPIRLTLLPNNFVVLPVSGGITIVPCTLMDMLSPGKNFGMLSGHTIYLKG
jgi:hypothetical protein